MKRNRLSVKQVCKFLDKVDECDVDGVLSSDDFIKTMVQRDAYNYLVDYVQLGFNGINQTHEGNRLFDLCVDILKEFIALHSDKSKWHKVF